MSLSKVFLPQFSPSGETPQEFVRSPFHPEGEPQSAFEVQWPPLLSGEEARQVNQAAKEMEEKILKQARDRAFLIEREAYEKGFAQGERDGLELGEKRLESVLDTFHEILEETGRLRRDLYQKCEGEMVQLVFALTRKILRHDLPLPEGWVKETVKAAFQYVLEPRKVILHLSPKDYQYFLSHPGDFLFSREGKEEDKAQVVADPSITRGGCFLETPLGDIDATLENQIEALTASVWQKFEQSTLCPDQPDP
jgi:flagellar assembly protein FliH